MHDPLTVAFEIRRPWPQRDRSPMRVAHGGWWPRGIVRLRLEAHRRQGGGRWYTTPFLEWRGRRWYFPSLITVWHVDPEKGGDDRSCYTAFRKRWGFNRAHWVYKLHVWHWQVQVHPWQKLRRWLFVRCAGCGKRFSWSYAPLSFSWEGGGPVYHHDHHHEPDKPPCSLLHRRKSYEQWKLAYPNLVGGEFDQGDPIDNWLDRSSMEAMLAVSEESNREATC